MTDTEESLGIIFGADDIRQSSLEHLARYSVLLRMKKGQHLYREREEIVTVYAVVSGTAALYKMNAMGEKKVIFVLGRGSLLNEEILQDLPEPVSCEIMEEALILAVPRKQLLALMETDARLMRFLFSSQSQRGKEDGSQAVETGPRLWEEGEGRCPHLSETDGDPACGYAGDEKGDSLPPAQSSGGTGPCPL